MAVDGVSVGTFASDAFGHVCVQVSSVLADGSHLLTGRELAPNAANVVTPFSFSVDTVAPAVPSVPVVASYSDSGVKGDSTTMFRNVSVTGLSDPGVPVRLFDSGVPGIGGAAADATGHWTARTTSLADGVHLVSAAAVDQAGDMSACSAALALRVDGTVPSVSLTAPAAGATVAGTVALDASAADAGSGVAKVDFQVDGVTKSTDSSSPYGYDWGSGSVANGAHTLTALATDVAGNTASVQVAVTVQNGAGATVPGAPSLNSAVAGNGTVALAWSAPWSDGGSAITGYRIYRTTVSGGETLLTTLGNVTSYTDSTATNGTTYFYKVSAVNSVGEGSRSNERSATPAAPATVPGCADADLARPAGNGSVALAWSAPASDGGSRDHGLQGLPRHARAAARRC